MAAPNRVDQPPASPTTTGQDPGLSQDQEPTQLLSKLFAGTTLGVPTNAPAAVAAVGVSVSPVAGNDPGATSSSYGDKITRVLTSMLPAKPPLAAPPLQNIFAQPAPPFPNPMAGRDPYVAPYRIRIRPDITELLEKLVGEATTPVKPEPAGGGHAERAARRREERRLFSVPTDYLRAGQESRERRRRRAMVRRNVRRIFSIHKDRANDRVLSAMMARQATLEPVADGGSAAAGSAASKHAATPSSSEDPELGELLMELSFKD